MMATATIIQKRNGVDFSIANVPNEQVEITSTIEPTYHLYQSSFSDVTTSFESGLPNADHSEKHK
jgi:hypothetical protein